jgi:hypothetical protein
MAYIDQSKKAEIAPKIKAILAKYGMKGSLSIHHHSSLGLKLKSGKLDLIGNVNKVCGADFYQVAKGFVPISNCVDVNPYHYRSHHDGECLAFLDEVFAALNEGNHDRSDIQSDYFDVGWYVSVKVGSWNQPYELV